MGGCVGDVPHRAEKVFISSFRLGPESLTFSFMQGICSFELHKHCVRYCRHHIIICPDYLY